MSVRFWWDDPQVDLTFDGEPTVDQKDCAACGRSYDLVRSFVLNDGDAYAVVFAACHAHGVTNEAWIDVIFGSWEEDDSTENVTFGCRVGPVDGQSGPAASAVDAAAPYSDSTLWGSKLTRQEALTHQRIGDFWTVIDFVLTSDPHVRDHVYGAGATFA